MRRAALVLALALAGCEFEVFGTPACAGCDRTSEAASLAPSNLPAFFDCLRESGNALVAAHRGGPGPGYAENALPTFERTTEATPALLEIDIARTRDNVLVLMHDDTVDRTTDGSGAVRDLTLAQVQALRLQDEDGRTLAAHPPTLRQALDWAAERAILELDVKRGVSFEDVVAEVRAAGALNRVIFITYSEDAAMRVHALAPEVMLSAPIDEEGDLDALAARGVDLTRVLAWTGTEEPNAALNVALAQRGVEAMFGTLGDPAHSWDGRFAREGRDQYAAFADSGLAVIATDRPIEASRDLDANDGAEGIGALQCASGR
jgi:glycerophosphoryl diester phosphodiesterase